MIKLDRLQVAVKMLEDAVHKSTEDPNNRKHCSIAHALSVIAHAYAGLDRFSEAIKNLTEAIAIWSYLSDGQATTVSHMVIMDDKHRLSSHGVDVAEVAVARRRLQLYVTIHAEEAAADGDNNIGAVVASIVSAPALQGLQLQTLNKKRGSCACCVVC
jgi:tetratricopeptide (TPR) repeat protein